MFLKLLLRRFLIQVNRIINYNEVKNKVFCIGLHKTGTTSLHNFAIQFGFKSIHSTDWMCDHQKLENFEFFSDGGSHFDNRNEFDFQLLSKKFPKAKFILQTRETESWIKSKLIHAGWNSETLIERDNPEIYNWTYKSLEVISRMISHKINYERKVCQYFNEHFPDRLIVIDITHKKNQLQEIKRLQKFLGVFTVIKVWLPHSNRGLKNSLPKIVEEKIASVLYNLDKESL